MGAARRALSVLLAALVLLMSLALPGKAWADGADDVSFYRITSVAAGSFDKAITEDKVPVVDSAADAGCYTAFVANDLEDVPIIGFMVTQVTSGASSASFAAFRQIDDAAAAKSNHWNDNLSNYGHYGYLLSQLGYDTVLSASSSILQRIWHFISGGALLLVYILAELVSVVMSSLIWVIKFFNPFAMFASGIDAQFHNGLMDADASQSTFYGDTTKFLGNLYRSLSNVSWAVLMPLFLASIIFTLIILLRRKGAGKGGDTTRIMSKVKAFVVRAMFIVLGIPLLGGLYTMALDAMFEEMSFSNLNADSLVASQFVDFEHWAANSALQVPSNVTLTLSEDRIRTENNVLAGDLTNDTLINTRNNAFEINKLSGVYSGLTSANGGVTSNRGFDWSVDSYETDAPKDAAFATSLSLISRYMSSATYESTDYESMVKAGALNSLPSGLTAGDDGANGSGKSLKIYLDELAKSSSYSDGILSLEGDAANVDSHLNWFGNGELNVSVAGGEYAYSHGNGQGLSTIAMYNYLNAEFTGANVIQYSTQAAISNLARGHHLSVSMVGTGFYGVMLWANAVALLLAFAILGIFYCFGMVFSNIKHAIGLVMAIPFGMLGALKSIIKVVTLAIVMVLEVLMTFFAYALMCDLLLFVNDLAINWLPSMFGAQIGGLIGLQAGVLLSVVFLILFIIVSLRVRKMLVRAMTEVVESTVDNLLGDGTSQGIDPKKAAAAGALGGLASGAMMGAQMANRRNASGTAGAAPGVAGVAGADGGADAAGAESSEDDPGALPPGGGPGGVQGVEGAEQQGVGPDAGAGGADAPAEAPSASSTLSPDASDGEAATAAKLDRMTGATSVTQDEDDAAAKSAARKAAVADTAQHAGSAVVSGVTGNYAGAAMEGAQAAQSAHSGATAGKRVDAARARGTQAAHAAPARTSQPSQAAQNVSAKQLAPNAAQQPAAPAPQQAPAKAAKVIKKVPKPPNVI